MFFFFCCSRRRQLSSSSSVTSFVPLLPLIYLVVFACVTAPSRLSAAAALSDAARHDIVVQHDNNNNNSNDNNIKTSSPLVSLSLAVRHLDVFADSRRLANGSQFNRVEQRPRRRWRRHASTPVVTLHRSSSGINNVSNVVKSTSSRAAGNISLDDANLQLSTGHKSDVAIDFTTTDNKVTSGSNVTSSCSVTCDDWAATFERIKQLVDDQTVRMIEYRLRFVGYNSTSGSDINESAGSESWRLYDVTRWSRVRDLHSLALQSVASSYDVMSLRTLAVGKELLDVDVRDHPPGCLALLDELHRCQTILHLLLRDFQASTLDPDVSGDERICHRAIVNDSGEAVFVDRCCYEEVDSGSSTSRRQVCDTYSQRDNFWLQLLEVAVALTRIVTYFFCPLLCTTTVLAMARKSYPYVVTLPEPLVRTVVFSRGDMDDDVESTTSRRSSGQGQSQGQGQQTTTNVDTDSDQRKNSSLLSRCRRHLDLRNVEGFPKLRRCAVGVQTGKPLRIRISHYDLLVNYERLVEEHVVPVGFWNGLASAILGCQLNTVEPFAKCCDVDMFRVCAQRSAARDGEEDERPAAGTTGSGNVPATWKRRIRAERVPWINMWRWVGLAVAVTVVLPAPFYIRLSVYYAFESDEVLRRRLATERLGLRERFDFNLVNFLTPTHPLFVAMFAVYFLTALLAALTTPTDGVDQGPLQRLLCDSFDDLSNLSWTQVVHTTTSNLVWPFHRYGLAACTFILVYWPVVIPLTIILGVFYSLPVVFLTVSIARFAWSDVRRRLRHSGSSFLLLDRMKIRMNAVAAAGTGDEDLDDGGLGGIFDIENVFRRCGLSADGPDIEVFDVRHDPSALDSMINTVMRRRATDAMLTAGLTLRPSRRQRHDSVMQNWIVSLFASTLCLFALHSLAVVTSECVGFVVEVLIYALMIVVANAERLLKYAALIVILVVYTRDCFDEIYRRYVELNRALFAEIKGRVGDVEQVTSRPFYLQENTAFQSIRRLSSSALQTTSGSEASQGQRLSATAGSAGGAGGVVVQTGDDDVARSLPRHWFVGGLLLFIDSNDNPRIPRRLFNEVCDIRVAGVPGPAHRAYLSAVGRLLGLVVFVFFIFVVILSFSETYKVSATNQTLAALAGGLLPIILRAVRRRHRRGGDSSSAPRAGGGGGGGGRAGCGRGRAGGDLESVSFSGRLDEVIDTYRQLWPMCDFEFELESPPGVARRSASSSTSSGDVEMFATPSAGSCDDVGRSGDDDEVFQDQIDYYIQLP